MKKVNWECLKKGFTELVNISGIEETFHKTLFILLQGIQEKKVIENFQYWELQLLTGNETFYSAYKEKMKLKGTTKIFYALWSGNIALLDKIKKEEENLDLDKLYFSHFSLSSIAIWSRKIETLDWLIKQDVKIISSCPEQAAKIGWLEGLIWFVNHNHNFLHNKRLFLNLESQIIIPFFHYLKTLDYGPILPMQHFVYYLIEKDYIEMMEVFLEEFPDLLEIKIKGGLNILHVAAICGSSSMLELLASKKQALKFQKDDKERNFLDYALFGNETYKLNIALGLLNVSAPCYPLKVNHNFASISIEHTFLKEDIVWKLQDSLIQVPVFIKNNIRINSVLFPSELDLKATPKVHKNIQKALQGNQYMQDLLKVYQFTLLFLIAKINAAQCVSLCATLSMELIKKVSLASLKTEFLQNTRQIPWSLFDNKEKMNTWKQEDFLHAWP